MHQSKQEISLSLNSLRNLLIKLAKDFISNDDETYHFYALLKNIKEYHRICIDKIPNRKSIWLDELFRVYRKLEKLPFGAPVNKLIKDELEAYIVETYLESDDSRVEVSLKGSRSEKLCIKLAQQSNSKLLISDLKNKHPLHMYSFREFNNTREYKKNCTLLRYPKIIKFLPREDTHMLISLSPYLISTESVTIFDAYLFKFKTDLEIVELILSYAPKIKSAKIYTKTSKQSKNGYYEYSIDALKKKYKKIKVYPYDSGIHHRRWMETDAYEIGLDNSIMNFKFEDDKQKLIAIKDVNITFDKKNND